MAPINQKPGPGGRAGSLGPGGAPLSIDLKTRKPPSMPSPVHPYNKVGATAGTPCAWGARWWRSAHADKSLRTGRRVAGEEDGIDK